MSASLQRFYFSERAVGPLCLTRMRFAISTSSLSFVSLSNSKGSFLVKTPAGAVSAALRA
jgi:hypothetical protein